MKYLVLFLVLITGCTRKPVDVDKSGRPQIQVSCAIVSKTDTGKREYCGKACFQPVYLYAFDCGNGVVGTRLGH